MLQILGIGSAYAAGASVSSGSPQEGAASCRPSSVLPADYLERTHNRDPLEAPLAAFASPTDLAHAAALQALERAGLGIEQVSMIVGDSATPRQKTPSEAQRLGKRFGTKIPAFDIGVGSAALVQHLDVFNSWQTDRVPEVVLAVSTNTPTENLSTNSLSMKFCDAAAALVLSTRRPGKLKVVESFCSSDPQVADLFTIDTFGYLKVNASGPEEMFASRVDQMLAQLVERGLVKPGQFRLVSSLVHQTTLRALRDRYQLAPHDCWYEQVFEQGDSLGSSAGRILADRWAELGDGKRVVVVTAGSGMSYGYAVLE